MEVLADSTAGNRRTLTLRVVPQRQVRLLTLHLDVTTATVQSMEVAGGPVRFDRITGEQRWDFGVVFHAPPPEGIEVDLVVTPKADQLALRMMDASDGLAALPGFRPPSTGRRRGRLAHLGDARGGPHVSALTLVPLPARTGHGGPLCGALWRPRIIRPVY